MKILAGKPLGPGPGAYKLPTLFGYPGHDDTKTRYPQWTMRTKPDNQFCTLGPGPAYNLDEWTRCGKNVGPSWSIGCGRVKECPGAMKTPGPGPVECLEVRLPRAPAYSIPGRHSNNYCSYGPGPGAYDARLKLEAPAWTMSQRSNCCEKRLGPGPVYFQKDDNVYLHRAPIFSMGGRCSMSYCTQSPGPGAYGKLYNCKKCPPVYSFGCLHCEFCPPMITREDEMGCGYNCHD